MQVESTHLQSSSNLTAGDGEVISPTDSKCPNLCPNDADEFPLFSENSDALSCKGEKQRRGTNRTVFPSFLASTFIVVYIRGLMRVTLALGYTFLKAQIRVVKPPTFETSLGAPIIVGLRILSLSVNIFRDAQHRCEIRL